MLQVDYDLLFAHPLPAESLNKAFAYYQTWWDSPVAVKALLHAAALAPVLALAIKLNAWTESAIFFDGSSLGAFPSFPSVPFLFIPLSRFFPRDRSGLAWTGWKGGWGQKRDRERPVLDWSFDPSTYLLHPFPIILHLTAQAHRN